MTTSPFFPLEGTERADAIEQLVYAGFTYSQDGVSSRMEHPETGEVVYIERRGQQIGYTVEIKPRPARRRALTPMPPPVPPLRHRALRIT